PPRLDDGRLPAPRAGRRGQNLPPPRHALRDEDRAPGARPRGAGRGDRPPTRAGGGGSPSTRREPVLSGLAGEARILRPTGDSAYEIYHDALAGPILDWRGGWPGGPRRPGGTGRRGPAPPAGAA